MRFSSKYNVWMTIKTSCIAKMQKMLQRNVKTIDMPDYVFILPRDKWMLWE